MNLPRINSVPANVIVQLCLLLAGSATNCLAETPADLKTMLNQIYMRMRSRDYEGASPIAAQAVAKYPQNYEARVARGRVYLGLEEESKAVDDFKWALQSKPKDYEVTSDLANAYSFMSDQKSALKYIDMAIANCQQNASFLGAYYMQKSNILKRVERYDEAEQAQTKALQYVNSDPHWYYERLKLRIKLSRWQGSVEDASHCLEPMTRFRADILQMRAKAYAGLKKYPEAERDLDEAIRRSPENRALHQDRYAVYQLEGKKEMAEKEHKLIEKLGDII